MRSLKNLGGLVVPGRYRFHEPDETKTFAKLSELLDFVADYRKARDGAAPDMAALQAEVEDWICGKIGSAAYYCMEDGRPMAMPDHTGASHHGNGYQGQAKWRELHRWALFGEGVAIPRAQWLQIFADGLPCGECRREWKKLVKANPAPLDGTAEELWRWGFERHQDLRRRLGQPLITEEEARAIYQP